MAPAAERQKQLQIKQLEELRGARATAEFTLVDLNGAPVVNQEFLVEHDTGARKGATDGDGHAKVPVPKEGKFKVTLAGERSVSSTYRHPAPFDGIEFRAAGLLGA